MKGISILLFLCLIASPALAFQLGPATPAVGHGTVNVGAGYFFYQGEWDGIDIEQNRAYLHAGYLMGIEDEPRWEIFVRGGGADLEASSENFDADFEPFGAVGIKGAFWDGPRFGWGLVAQGGIFANFDANGATIKDLWEIEAGLPFQTKAGPFLFYAGPVFYSTEADDIEEKNNFGGFGGLALSLGAMRLELEGQLKSKFSAGGFLSYSF